ncbi:MAG: hypothetical protein HOQ07_09280, partial [Sinomonas sp.]|nr:hypothetical protein [Sinomonas sp.]
MTDTTTADSTVAGANYTVAVLGLGAMGLPMATRLATGRGVDERSVDKLSVHGFDSSSERRELAAASGVATCDAAR